MVKKIGCVIAYHEGQNNYGTSLQGLATIKKIESLGYPCEIIRYRKHRSIWEKMKLICILFYSGDYSDHLRALRKKMSKLTNKEYGKNLMIRTNAVNAFKDAHLKPLFKEYDGYEALQKGSMNYAEVMVGSDQVWSLLSLYGNYYNLMFVDSSIPTFSYASSFGVSTIPKFQIKRTKAFLDKLNQVGVREVSGKAIVDSISQNKAKVVADPTLLLTKEEWKETIKDSHVSIDEPYIFCYFLGKNEATREAVRQLAKSTGLKVVVIRHMDEYIESDESFGDYAPYDVDPLDFVKYISKAAYVCTDSFHGTVFSIIFERKFMTFYRYALSQKGSRNSRIDSLLGILGIKDRIFNGDIERIKENIDYNSVGQKLAEFRDDSEKYLQDCLKMSNLK